MENLCKKITNMEGDLMPYIKLGAEGNLKHYLSLRTAVKDRDFVWNETIMTMETDDLYIEISEPPTINYHIY